jgi:hypothetical protein
LGFDEKGEKHGPPFAATLFIIRWRREKSFAGIWARFNSPKMMKGERHG